MNPSDFVPATEPTPEATPAPTPTAEVDPDAPVYPDLATLLDIGGGRAGRLLARRGHRRPRHRRHARRPHRRRPDLAHPRPLGLHRRGRVRRDRRRPRARRRRRRARLRHRRLARAAARHRVLDETALRGAALTAATAYLAFASAETDGAPLLVALDRDTRPLARRPAQRDHDRHAGARASPRSPSGGSPPRDAHDVEIADAAADPARVATASALFADETTLSRFATILDDTSLHHRPRARRDPAAARRRLARPTPTTWSTAVADHRAATATTLDSRRICCRPSTDQPLRLGAPISDSGCATTCPTRSTSSCTRRPTTCGSTCSAATPLVAGRREQHARRGAGAGAGRQRRGDARAAAAQPRERRDRRRHRRSTSTCAPSGRASASSRSSIVVGGLLVLGVVRTVLRMRARREGARRRRPRTPSRRAGDAEPASTRPGRAPTRRRRE